MTNQTRLKQIKIEDYIFIIYYLIITLSLYANFIERKYIIFKNPLDKEKYRNLLFIIFGIAFLVYLYYAISNYQDIKQGNDNDLNKLSFVASLLVLISGIIYLYIIYQDKDINIELAFN